MSENNKEMVSNKTQQSKEKSDKPFVLNFSNCSNGDFVVNIVNTDKNKNILKNVIFKLKVMNLWGHLDLRMDDIEFDIFRKESFTIFDFNVHLTLLRKNRHPYNNDERGNVVKFKGSGGLLSDEHLDKNPNASKKEISVNPYGEYRLEEIKEQYDKMEELFDFALELYGIDK